jgi:hypothetical protein
VSAGPLPLTAGAVVAAQGPVAVPPLGAALLDAALAEALGAAAVVAAPVVTDAPGEAVPPPLLLQAPARSRTAAATPTRGANL